MKIKDISTKQVFEINVTKSHGEEYMLCPKCSHTRKKTKDKCLSWSPDKNVGYCNHCQSSFVKYRPLSERTAREYVMPKWKNITELTDKATKWFESRGISQSTLSKMRIYSDNRFMRIKTPSGNILEKSDAEVMAFPMFMPGEDTPRNIKYRGANKSFAMEAGAELVFYNFNQIPNNKEIVIVEGEIDALSYIEAGVENVVSVPNGAGAKDLTYLDNYIDELDHIERFYIATDYDEKGLELREELIRRLGSERCLIVTFQGYKDANELLVSKGAESLRMSVLNAQEIPLRGEVDVETVYDRLQTMYSNGLPKGVKLNFPPIDEMIGWETGRLCILTGIPSHGKSNLLDFINVRLNIVNGWKTAYWSPENFPVELHIANLSEKIIGKKFGIGNMSEIEFEAAYEYVKDNFFFINPEENTTLDGILAVAKQLVRRRGIKHLVIDPLNALSSFGDDESRTIQIEKMLDVMVRFARKNNILLTLVAHPTKMPEENGRMKVPTMYNISGSSTFYDKADYGLVVYRYFDLKKTQLFVQKMKWRNLGRINEMETDGMMMFNPANGRYDQVVYDYRMMDNKNYLEEIPVEQSEFQFLIGTDFDDLPE